MDIVHAIILGIVQGATEFIPVSSTGHLILARDVFGLATSDALAFDAVLQLASILAVVIVLWQDLIKIAKSIVIGFTRPRLLMPQDKQLLVALVVGTIPAILAGLVLENAMETVFRGPLFVVIGLLLGSGLMLFAEHLSFKRTIHTEVTPVRGFLVGLYQALALFPGISRSGATISGGLFAGFDRVQATRFSFLLSIPIIVGAGGLKLGELLTSGNISLIVAPLIVGSITSFLVAFVAVRFLLAFVKTHSLRSFIWYRLLLACIILVALV